MLSPRAVFWRSACRNVVVALVALLVAGNPRTVTATQGTRETAAVLADASAVIEARIGQIRNSAEVRIGSASIASAVVLPEFYEERGYRLAWQDPVNLAALLTVIRDSAADGLSPEDYHLGALLESIDAPPSPERDADLDMLATDGALRLAYHLRFGKVDPKTIDPDWNYKRHYDPALVASASAALEAALAQHRIEPALDVLRPAHPLYSRLRGALQEYRGIQAAGGWKPVPGGRALRPGGTDPRLPALRERLRVEADLQSAPAEHGPRYDEETEAAVRRFQERHGLAVDGIVGGRTLRTLNVPVQSKIDRLRLALERGRLLLHDLPERYVVVNVPGYRLYYSGEAGRRFATNVVVGKIMAKTPIFRAEMSYVVLNPTWTVPRGIVERDIRPGLRKDPAYLRKKGLRRVGRQIVQDPGPDNALGRIKLMFPNPHMVYLHDTPQQELFERAARTFSSGCIRVQNVFDLAALVLDEPQRWSRDQLLEAVATGKTQTIVLKRRVPILITYWTAAAAPDGRVFFYEDIYGRDPDELAALDAPFRFSKPARQSAGRKSALQ